MRIRLQRRFGWVVVAAGLVAGVVGMQAQSEDFVPVTDTILQNPDDGDWLMWRRTLNGWGYSPLDQIDRSNVGRLRLAWARAMERGRANRRHSPMTECCTSRIRAT